MRILALYWLAVAAAFAVDARSSVRAAPWCSTYGGMSCGYNSLDQCLASIRGVGGNCVRNAAERSSPPAGRREANPRRATESKPAAVAPQEKPPTQRGAFPAPVVQQPPQSTPASQVQQAVKSFAQGRMLILSGQYEAGLAAMLALGDDARPDVAASIGFASSKLGRLDDAKVWYEKALTADPNHVAALSNYGMLRVQQGDVVHARDDLEKIKTLCGGDGCREYRELAAAIAAKAP